MDLLKAELKRKDGPAANGTGPPAKRYQRKGDIQAAKQLEEQQAAELKRKEQAAKLLDAGKKVARAEEAAGASLSKGAFGGGDTGKSAAGKDDPAGAPEAFNVSNEEAVRRLRARGQPIRLFGESDKERRLRLRALQLIEERTEGGRNELMRALEGLEGKMELEEMEKRAKAATAVQALKSQAGRSETPEGGTSVAEEKKPGEGEDVLVDLSLLKNEPRKVYPQIYYALKRVLKEWEQSMAERPDDVRRSTQGKLAAATQQQSAENLKPLFKTLRNRNLDPDVLQAIAEIVHNMQTRQYIAANDAYLKLSIGNAPWPIGVTMVGIHERSGREKIFSQHVAHVLNDEVSRKYIQSLKRILTFAQTIRPPSDLSQKMG